MITPYNRCAPEPEVPILKGTYNPDMLKWRSRSQPCPKCDSNNHRGFGGDSCQKCGTPMYIEIKDKPPTKEELEPDERKKGVTTKYTCTICGKVRFKRRESVITIKAGSPRRCRSSVTG